MPVQGRAIVVAYPEGAAEVLRVEPLNAPDDRWLTSCDDKIACVLIDAASEEAAVVVPLDDEQGAREAHPGHESFCGHFAWALER